MYQGARECQFLLHTARQGSCLALAEGFYLTVYVLDAIIALLYGRAEEGCKELQIFLYGQILIEGETSGHIPHTAPDVLHAAHAVVSIDGCSARSGQQQGGEDAEHRGLPCPVWTDNAKLLAPHDTERHIIERTDTAIVFRHVVYHYTFIFHHNFTSPYMPILM
jgi:hypothetical protein